MFNPYHPQQQPQQQFGGGGGGGGQRPMLMQQPGPYSQPVAPLAGPAPGGGGGQQLFSPAFGPQTGGGRPAGPGQLPGYVQGLAAPFGGMSLNSGGPPPNNMAGLPPNSMAGPPPNNMAGLPPNNMAGLPPNNMAGLPSNSMAGPPPNNMAGLPPNNMAGLPPNSMAGLPPNSMAGLPPNSMAGLPPNSMAGLPPNSMAGPPPNSMAGPSQNNMAGLPPNNMAGLPPNSMGGPPSNNMAGLPPNNMAGLPPNSMAGPPPNNMAGLPPNSMGGLPPNSMAGLPPNNMAGLPPNSMAGPPPNNMAGLPPNNMAGLPPNSMAGPPPNNMAGLPPNSMAGPPPNSMAGLPPNNMAGPPQNNMAGPPQNNMAAPQPGNMMMGMPGLYRPQPAAMPGPPGAVLGPPGAGMPGTMAPASGPGMMAPGPMGPGPMGPGALRPPGAGMHPPQPAPTRMDPESMPNPVAVMAMDSQANGGSEYFTSNVGQPPPLVTTSYRVRDNGVCSPRFMRSTLYNLPASDGMAQECRVPVAIIAQPLADVQDGELEPPLVDHGKTGPVRCKRCKAYMNPFTRFTDGGRSYLCAFCQCSNEVPGEYFSYLDHSGRRTDIGQRPELSFGSYEFVATEEYCKKGQLPSAPAYLFLLDVSAPPLQNGMVNLLAQNIKRVLACLPRSVDGQPGIRVGFAAYDTAIYFFNLKAASGVPQMMVVTDVQDVFVPLVDGVLVSPQEAMQSIESLFNQLPGMFIGCKKPSSTLGPALKAGLEALRSGGCCGKLLVFHHGLPSLAGPGQLKDRMDSKLLGTDKEKNLLNPSTSSNFYSKLSEECVEAGVGIDLFMSTTSYSDLATIGYCVTTTGGDLYHYPMFKASLDGEKLIGDLSLSLERRIGFDCVMRLRASTGIRSVEYYGGFFKSNPTDMEFGCLDSERAVAVELKHDERLKPGELVYFQAALLYTSRGGQRRLRVHNLQLSSTTDHTQLYRGCDQDSILCLLLKRAVQESLSRPHKTVASGLTSQCVKMLTTYRKHCSQNSAAGQLILPESLKLLPIYLNCLLKCAALCSPPLVSVDHKSWMMWRSLSLGPAHSVPLLYPHLYQLHDLRPESSDPPPLLRCTSKKMADNGVYLIENGAAMAMWVGSRVSNDFVSQVFGVGSQAQIDPESSVLPSLDNALSSRVRAAVELVRARRSSANMKLRLCKQRDKSEVFFRSLLCEDSGPGQSLSYIDYLCLVHKEIKQALP